MRIFFAVDDDWTLAMDDDWTRLVDDDEGSAVTITQAFHLLRKLPEPARSLADIAETARSTNHNAKVGQPA